MTGPRSYEIDPYRRELETRVVETGSEGGRLFAVLADTVLYPEGGGQPADRGWLGAVTVIDVQRAAGGPRHYLAEAVSVGPVRVRLDWSRRFDHMQQHTAQHLITALARRDLGWRTRAFHLGERGSDVELDVAPPGTAELERLEESVMAEVRAARPVTTRRVTPEQYAMLEVRSRGLPAGHTGDVRLVEIAGIDVNTCGGTHVASTAELEAVKLLGAEPLRGGCRLHWLAGGRVRRRLAEREEHAAALRRLFDTGDDDLAGVAAARLGQVRELERRGRRLEERLADAMAEALATHREPLLELHLEEGDAAFLQRLARRTVALAPDSAVLITAGGGSGGLFLLAAGDELVLDVVAAGRRVAELLEGRGGGAGRFFQGRTGSLAGRCEAVAAVTRALGG